MEKINGFWSDMTSENETILFKIKRQVKTTFQLMSKVHTVDWATQYKKMSSKPNLVAKA